MNIVVIGGGAVGSVVATDLARAGADVTLCVRSAALPPSGTLRTLVEETGQEPRWAIVPVSTAITETPDLVMLCVKAPDFAGAVAGLAAKIGDAPVVALHAAPQGDGAISAALGRAVIGGLFLGSAEYRQVGHAHVAQPRLALDHAIQAHAPLAGLLAAALPTTFVAEMPRWRWTHLLVTLPQMFAALVNLPLAELAADHTIQALTTTLLVETGRVYAKAGILPAPWPAVDVARLARVHSMPGMFAGRVMRQDPALFTLRGALLPPLLQSLRRQRPTEVDALSGEIIRLGQQYGVAMPLTTRLLAMIHDIEHSGTSISLERLKQAIGRI